MSLTRKEITEIIDSEESIDAKVKKLLDRHHEEIDSTKDALDEAVKRAETAEATLEKEKSRADKAEKDYGDFKAAKDAEATFNAKSKIFSDAMKDANIGEKYREKVLKHSKDLIEAIELDESGAAKDSKKLIESITGEWGEYVTKTRTRGEDPANPPKNQNQEKKVGSLADALRARSAGE